MTRGLFSQTGQNARLILRRDRIRLPIWLLAIILLTIVVAFAYTGLVPTEQERMVMAETMRNPAVTAMFGPGFGLDDYDYGAIMGHQMLLFTALIVGIMSVLIVARHTRGDEENGRIEMIRSFPVGRVANLSATTLVLLGANILLAILTGIGLWATGIEGLDLGGSMLYGAVLGVSGFFFAATTAFFAQLFESSRGTMGVSFAFLGFAYLLRAVGDVGNETLSLISPLGLVIRAEVYVNNYWWPVLLTFGLAIVITGLAYYLHSLRDLEAGFIPSRPGRKHASIFLQSPFGLALRLQRTAILGWVGGMLVLGASYGSVLGDLETYLEAMELIQAMLPDVEGFSLVEQFLPMLMAVISMICTIPVLLMVLKIKGEETKNRTEHLLARAVSRSRIMGSFLVLSLVVGFLVLSFGAIGMWSAGAAAMDEPIPLATILPAAMVYFPAILVMIGVAMLLVGNFPGAKTLAWGYLAYSFLVVYLGAILQLPDYLAVITPFGHIPRYPVEEIVFFNLFLLALIGILLIIGGFWGYKKRDIFG